MKKVELQYTHIHACTHTHIIYIATQFKLDRTHAWHLAMHAKIDYVKHLSFRALVFALDMCILYYVRVHLSPLFPLITFVVKMMYLQIICQHEALQILETIKQKALQLACKQVKYGSTEVFHIFPMELKTCTDKL